ncbi:uncharacterized protein LOC123534095 [Mercenaria mercenaria]|uniref:uncharacterized protein LOC123534095 n=1 Tax=Mercenaria mercenaria TaxID=6596 RepID=UPI00234F8D0A|nr:uncharacterized protein LOC123534095 [Mercenaria mercenaria]
MGCSGSSAVKKDKDTQLAQLHQSTALQCEIKPHYFVLEIGFGKGQGLEEALKHLQGGSGRVIGTETSQKLLDEVTKKLKDDIATGTLELDLCLPETLTYINSMFDCVYNVNGFFYWEDINTTVQEIYRILRAGCLFLTCVHKKKNELTLKEQQELKNPDFTIQQYADMLKEHGFVKIKIQEHRNAHSGFKYQTVQAFARRRK